MQIAQDIRTAPELTAQARAAATLAGGQYRLGTYLPAVENYGLTFSFTTNEAGLTDAASFRSWNTEAPLGRVQGGGAAKTGKLPPISQKMRVDELEQLRLYQNNDAIAAKFEEYARKVGTSIAARVAFAQAEAIEHGTLTIEENGLGFTVDYGRKAEHDVVAATPYTDLEADVISDFEAWTEVYRASNGGNPGVALLSTQILTLLTKNKVIIAAAVGRQSDLPTRVSFEDVRSVLRSYAGINSIDVYDQAIDGRRLISANKLILLPDSPAVSFEGGPLGTTQWGIPAEAIRPAYGIAENERPGVFSGAYDSADPEGTFVLGSAVVLPALQNADATLVAELFSK